MYLNQLEKTLKSFAVSHRDNKIKRRFSTMVTGGSGIGKTDIIKKLGTDLDMAVIITHVAQLEPGELLGIPRSSEIRKNYFVQKYDLPSYLPHYQYNDNGDIKTKTFEDGIQRKIIDVELLGSKVKNKTALINKHGDNWKEKVKGVILFLDEINRAVGDDTKQAIFELPGDYSLHEYEVPENCVIFAAANPSTNDYQVNEMDQEKAWMDRFVHLKAEGRIEDSLTYFKKNDFEESIVSFISSDEDALMEAEENFEINIKRTPRSYEVLNNILKYVDLPEDESIKREVFIGILGSSYGISFSNHLKQNLDKIPSGREVITNYQNIRPIVQQNIKENKLSFMNQMIRYTQIVLLDEEDFSNLIWRTNDLKEKTLPIEEHVQNLVNFIEDLPADARMALIKKTIDKDWVNDILGMQDIIYETLNNDNIDAHKDNSLFGDEG